MERPQTEKATDVFDHQELMTRCMGNEKFALRILGKFQDRLNDDLSELELAAAGGDLASVARIAHRIKGASANVAAHGLRERAAEVEDQALLQSLDEVQSLLVELRLQQSRFEESAASVSASASSS